jgi:hypothetical protein
MDGWRKNWQKFRLDWHLLSVEMPPHFKRWAVKPWDMHAYVNLYVESRRAAPYLVGHIDSVLYPLLIIFIIL